MYLRLISGTLAAVAIAAAACGGGSSKEKTATPAPVTPATTAGAATQKPATTGATRAAATTAPTAAGASPSAQATTGTTGGAVFDDTQARALLDAASLKPADVAADWVNSADTSIDNTAAAAADPTTADSIARCGRLIGRTVNNSPTDVTTAYVTGDIVAAFSQLTVYATADGAADCAAEGAVKFQQPGAFARAFGTIFKNPDAVAVLPVTYPQVGDGSFATALTGDIDAGGLTVQLQIVLVAFRKGNTTGVVGVAMSPLTTPSTKELQPYVDLVLQRIAANQ